MKGKASVIERVSLYLAKARKVVVVDTQAIRTKLPHHLEGVFDLAVVIAKGSGVTCEKSEHPL
jgi:hypothetical protein